VGRVRFGCRTQLSKVTGKKKGGQRTGKRVQAQGGADYSTKSGEGHFVLWKKKAGRATIMKPKKIQSSGIKRGKEGGKERGPNPILKEDIPTQVRWGRSENESNRVSG